MGADLSPVQEQSDGCETVPTPVDDPEHHIGLAPDERNFLRLDDLDVQDWRLLDGVDQLSDRRGLVLDGDHHRQLHWHLQTGVGLLPDLNSRDVIPGAR